MSAIYPPKPGRGTRCGPARPCTGAACEAVWLLGGASTVHAEPPARLPCLNCGTAALCSAGVWEETLAAQMLTQMPRIVKIGMTASMTKNNASHVPLLRRIKLQHNMSTSWERAGASPCRNDQARSYSFITNVPVKFRASARNLGHDSNTCTGLSYRHS